MKHQYRTNEIAKIIGIHANTVRKYEEWEFITKPERDKKGYRIFNELHIAQFKFARLALKCELVENGLRSYVIKIIQLLAQKKYNETIKLNYEYIDQIKKEEKNAKKAIQNVELLLSKVDSTRCYTKKEVLNLFHLTSETLHNWERNGLLTVIKKRNGYKIYTENDLRLISIIKTLRLANYSISSILRMLKQLQNNSNLNIVETINTPNKDENIISACDELLTSLKKAKKDANTMGKMLEEIECRF